MLQNKLEPVLRKKYLQKIQRELMLRRGWVYLAYLHLRDAFQQVHQECESFLSIGCGIGLAEIALALEFPETDFHLTEIMVDNDLKYRKGMQIVSEWSIPNVTFGFYDILTPAPARYDFVSALHVLEYIENDLLATAQMRAVSEKYIYTVVSFATLEQQSDPTLKERAWKRQQMYRVGYDRDNIQRLFPNVILSRGCYWNEGGAKLRQELEKISDKEIQTSLTDLVKLAEIDIKDQEWDINDKCSSILMLAKV